MHVTLYQRSYPVRGAPVALSLCPFAASQRHTFPVGGKVYEAEYGELRVVVPDGATLDPFRKLLRWAGRVAPVRGKPTGATAQEVLDLAQTGAKGFGMAK